MGDYLILGAWTPLAHEAFTADRKIGLLLPRNGTVRPVPSIARHISVDDYEDGTVVSVR